MDGTHRDVELYLRSPLGVKAGLLDYSVPLVVRNSAVKAAGSESHS